MTFLRIVAFWGAMEKKCMRFPGIVVVVAFSLSVAKYAEEKCIHVFHFIPVFLDVVSVEELKELTHVKM